MEIPRNWRLKKQRYSLVGEEDSKGHKIFPPRDVCPIDGAPLGQFNPDEALAGVRLMGVRQDLQKSANIWGETHKEPLTVPVIQVSGETAMEAFFAANDKKE